MEAIDIFFARILAALAISIFCLVGTACHAKKPPAPQYVNVAPLPGSGLALDSEGKPDGQGAMQINIPVAYTPGSDFASISAYAGQFARRDKSHPDWANGTGTLAFGFGKWPRVYGSAMAVSSLIWTDSKVLSGQMQVVKETERSPAIAIGAQDILNKEQNDFGATRNTGVSYLLYSKLNQSGLDGGYQWGETSWQLEDNDAVNKFVASVSGRVYKKYRIYDKKLA